MNISTRRARRALVPFTTAAVITAFAPSAAAAPRATVAVRVEHRTLVVEGGRADEIIRVFADAARPFEIVVQLGLDNPRDIATVHRDRFDDVVVRGGEGNDLIMLDEFPGFTVPFTDTKPTRIDGGYGDDVLLGGSGAEDLRGGPGGDVIDGNGGNDAEQLGAGGDTTMWDPGDGNDTIEGAAGSDIMMFNGAPINESFAAQPNGERLRFTRVQDSVVIDADGVEQVIVNTLGGSDLTDVGDLSRTDVTLVSVDDGSIAGGDGPDRVVDTVIASGTPRSDLFTLTGDDGIIRTQDSATQIELIDMDVRDAFTIAAGKGADTVDATAVRAGNARLVVLGGPGDDRVLGGDGADQVLAGPGRDTVDGNAGDDTISLDAGDDQVLWDPGDGSDLLDGGGGFDAMSVSGSPDDEVIDTSAIGDSLIVTHDLSQSRIDMRRLEQLDTRAFGGADVLSIGDLNGTTVQIVTVDLAATRDAPGGDLAADGVVVRGTPGDDLISATGSAGAARIDGLPWSIDIVNSEPTDVLTIDGNGGDDTVDTAGLGPDTIQPAQAGPTP